MKSIFIAGLIAGTLMVHPIAQAAPHGPKMRGHNPGMEVLHTLRGLSLSSAQKEKVKTLIVAFKENNVRPEKPHRPELAGLTEREISELVEAQIAQQASHQFAIASLRNDIYNLLTDSQKTLQSDQASSRDAKRLPMHSNRKNKQHRGPRLPFEDLDLTDDQLASVESLETSFRETRFQHKETMDSFKQAELELIQSSHFSESAWDALCAKYKDALVNAAVEEMLHKQAIFDVLTEAQQAELKARHDDDEAFRRLLHDN